jgi:hypothetical protein
MTKRFSVRQFNQSGSLVGNGASREACFRTSPDFNRSLSSIVNRQQHRQQFETLRIRRHETYTSSIRRRRRPHWEVQHVSYSEARGERRKLPGEMLVDIPGHNAGLVEGVIEANLGIFGDFPDFLDAIGTLDSGATWVSLDYYRGLDCKHTPAENSGAF